MDDTDFCEGDASVSSSELVFLVSGESSPVVVPAEDGGEKLTAEPLVFFVFAGGVNNLRERRPRRSNFCSSSLPILEGDPSDCSSGELNSLPFHVFFFAFSPRVTGLSKREDGVADGEAAVVVAAAFLGARR